MSRFSELWYREGDPRWRGLVKCGMVRGSVIVRSGEMWYGDGVAWQGPVKCGMVRFNVVS